MNDNQQKEIETIKERNVTIKLSDDDCERLLRKCGISGLSVGNLLESFIGDLIGGTHTNGSDERDFAQQWFERCWFGMYPEITLLNWLLSNMYYDVYDDFLEVIDDIESGRAELEDYKKDPSVFNEEEIEYLKTDIEDWENQIAEIKTEFLNSRYQFTHKLPNDFTEADWEKEVENVNKWWKEKERFLAGKEGEEK